METVPVTKPKITPKDFFLWFGAMIALYWSVVAFILLFFNYIDYAYPNVLEYQPNPYDGGIPYEMASIIVLFPIYLCLVYFIRHDIARDPSRKDVWIRKWAIILTLFVAAVTMAGDIIMLLTTYFSGAVLTTAFLFKIALIFLVAAAGFMHFAADLKGYWDTNRMRERIAMIAFCLLAFIAVFSGFLIVGTPQHARLMRLDSQKVMDLENIQWQVVNYWQQKEKLPASLVNLQDPISGFIVPRDPQTGAEYEYRITTPPLSFELCADFNLEGGDVGKGGIAVSRPTTYESIPIPAGASGMYDNWAHTEKETCFKRTIDPELYPSTSLIKPPRY